MLEYMRSDASVLLTVAVLITFALLTASIIVRMLGTASPFRLRLNASAWAGGRPGGRGDASPDRNGLPTIRPDGPTDVDLARLDDDGGGSRRARSLALPVPLPDDGLPPAQIELPFGPVERFHTPMIPGAREPGVLTTFGVAPVVFRDSPTTMDAATIAARQREGGGAPSERRPPRVGSPWTRLTQAMRRVFGG